MANLYTTDIVLTNPIPINGPGIFDSPSVFPTTNGYKMVFLPIPGEQIQAAQFRNISHPGFGPLELSPFGGINSLTTWPSRFQHTMKGLGDVDATTTSGFKEFPAFYKVVFEDSTNPNNDVNWELSTFGNQNKVYMWVYFGKNQVTPIANSNDISISLDIDSDPDPYALSETLSTVTVTPIITSFNI